MKKNTKLTMELLKMTRASLENLIFEFTRVMDISLENLNVTTAVDGEWVKIDSIRFYYDDMFFCGYLDDERTLGVSYDIFDIPNGGLMDIIHTLDSRLK
jgi:hypothetical protein